MFSYIIDRVRRRTVHWSAKSFSPAEKEIIMKSVVVSMPVYAMSCFKLPKGVTSEIETLLMNYWWERKANQRGIPWISWTRLKYSKKEGGLGFRDLEKFNDALLAKQVWRLIKFPNSLFARVMKARYYSDGLLLDAKDRKNQSYGWSSLLHGLNLIKKGTRFLVGDGKTIRLGKDNVLEGTPPREVGTIDPNSNMSLDVLIKKSENFREWDTEQINNIVKPTDIDAIKQVYLSQVETEDRLIWNYTTSGDYTVKSGYWFLTHNPFDLAPVPNIPHGSIDLRNRIWKLKILPKIRHFLWRVISRALPTTTRLRTRGMNIPATCARCNREDETILHALFTCPFARMVWRMSGISTQHTSMMFTDVEASIQSILDIPPQDDNLYDSFLPFWILWRIWKARNSLIFEDFREGPTVTILKAQSETKEWINNPLLRINTRTNPLPITSSWSPPSSPILKCNFDAAFDGSTHATTGGWIIRNHQGDSLVWGASKLPFLGSPLEAEAKALLLALKHAWIKGYTMIIFEGDCETLFKLVNGQEVNAALSNLLRDIQYWRSKFLYCDCTFIRRSCNTAAHSLAKFGCQTIDYYVESVIKPPWLIQQLCNDSV